MTLAIPLDSDNNNNNNECVDCSVGSHHDHHHTFGQ